MTAGLTSLPSAVLDALALALERGTLSAPYGALAVGRHVSAGEADAVVAALTHLAAQGLSGTHAAVALRLLASARRHAEQQPRPELVWSDLDLRGLRDTATVCNELFRGAREHVLVSTFSLGHRARDGEPPGNPVFRALAERMEERPQLHVRLFVNVRRTNAQGSSPERDVVRAFGNWFRATVWPWPRVPELFYDPRSLDDTDDSSCLHAKCIAVDDARALLTSANLTEAAHQRNIEAGVLLDDPAITRSLRVQFDTLVARGALRRVEP